MLTVLLRRAAWNEGSASSQQKSRSRDDAAVAEFDESRSSRSTKYSSLRRCKTSVDLELHSLGPASAFDGDDAPDDGGGQRLTASALARHEQNCALEALGLGDLGLSRSESFFRDEAFPRRRRERVSCVPNWFRKRCGRGA